MAVATPLEVLDATDTGKKGKYNNINYALEENYYVSCHAKRRQFCAYYYTNATFI